MRAVLEPPFFAGAILGLRAWVIEEHWPTGAALLGGIAAGGIWTPGGTWTEAECAVHSAPDHGCACGLYGFHPAASSARVLFDGHLDPRGMAWGPDPSIPELAGVVGVIEASGRIEVHRVGFRAERARVRAVCVGPGWPSDVVDEIEELATSYGVEVIEVSEAAELLAYCGDGGLTAAQLDELLGPNPDAREPATTSPHRLPDRRPLALLGSALSVIGQGIALLFCLAFGLFFYGSIALAVVAIFGGMVFGWFEAEPKPPPPARVAAVRIDRQACSVEAQVIAGRPVQKLRLRITGRNARGVGLGHLTQGVGAVQKGTTWVRAAGIDRKLCRSSEPFTTRVRAVWPGRLGRTAVVQSAPDVRTPGVPTTKQVQ